MGTIKSKIGRKFELKRKAKWVKGKANFGQGLLKSSLVGLPRPSESSVTSLLDRLTALTPSLIARKHGLEC